MVSKWWRHHDVTIILVVNYLKKKHLFLLSRKKWGSCHHFKPTSIKKTNNNRAKSTNVRFFHALRLWGQIFSWKHLIRPVFADFCWFKLIVDLISRGRGAIDWHARKCQSKVLWLDMKRTARGSTVEVRRRHIIATDTLGAKLVQMTKKEIYIPGS